MNKGKAHCLKGGFCTQAAAESEAGFWNAQRKLLAAWLFVGMLPFILQTRSYLKYATPHKISETLLVPPDVEQETTNLTALCPVEGVLMGQIWWNIEVTHYYRVKHGLLCHFVVPQYNTHGNYLMGSTKSTASFTTPASCARESIPFEQYLYHGSIGYCSFYEEAAGTYCLEDRTAYVSARALGTMDINGSYLVRYTGSEGYSWSYWYSIFGVVWLTFRGLVLRRAFISCKRYGRLCDLMGERLQRKTVMVFVHENLRLSAHGANNYHRVALLYLLAEGLMSDLFVLIANNGIFARVQYISLGYNLSGFLLLLFEIIESMSWMREKWRVLIKRALFCYESSLLGEVIAAAGQEHFITILNRSSLRRTHSTTLAVSYYFWSLVGHGAFVVSFIAFIISVRALWAVSYIRWKHGHTWLIFSTPCSVDTALGMRNKMTMLGGYQLEDGKLFYTTNALLAFGLLRMEEEDGVEFLVLRQLSWLTVPAEDLCVIGCVSGQHVVSCSHRPCTGVVSFFDRNLGGNLDETEISQGHHVKKRVSIVPTR